MYRSNVPAKCLSSVRTDASCIVSKLFIPLAIIQPIIIPIATIRIYNLQFFPQKFSTPPIIGYMQRDFSDPFMTTIL